MCLCGQNTLSSLYTPLGAFLKLGATSANFTKSLQGVDATIKLIWHNMVG